MSLHDLDVDFSFMRHDVIKKLGRTLNYFIIR